LWVHACLGLMFMALGCTATGGVQSKSEINAQCAKVSFSHNECQVAHQCPELVRGAQEATGLL